MSEPSLDVSVVDTYNGILRPRIGVTNIGMSTLTSNKISSQMLLI